MDKKATHAEYMRKWRAGNPRAKVDHAAYMRKWRVVHPSRKWVPRNSEKYNAMCGLRNSKTKWKRIASARYRDKHPERSLAHRAVYRAIKSGILVRPEKCEKCQRPSLVQGHHDDYSKQLEVVWLCRVCHIAIEGKVARVHIAGDPEPNKAPEGCVRGE